MSFFDKAKQALTGAVDKHGDQIAEGIDKAAQAIDDRTGGKHADKLATGAEQAKDALDRLDGRNDDIPDRGGHPAGTTDGHQGTHPARHRGEPRETERGQGEQR